MTARAFTFTLNNPKGLFTESDMEDWGANYLVFQLEMGASGTPHLQGYVQVPAPCRFSKFKGLEGAHFEKARGSPQQNKDYCTKEDTRLEGPFEYGVMRAGQGQRSDVLRLRDAIKSGKRGLELYEDDETCGPAVRYARGVAELCTAYAPRPDRSEVVVTFHYGPAGTGKTRCCMSDDAYFYDGMCGEVFFCL